MSDRDENKMNTVSNTERLRLPNYAIGRLLIEVAMMSRFTTKSLSETAYCI